MIVIKLKELLEKNNVSINELSDETGISRTSLTQLANGDSKMVRMETISKIMDFFSLDNITDLMEKISKYSYDVKQFKVDFKKKNISFEFSYNEDETNGSFKVIAPFIFEDDIIKINFFNLKSTEDITNVLKMIDVVSNYFLSTITGKALKNGENKFRRDLINNKMTIPIMDVSDTELVLLQFCKEISEKISKEFQTNYYNDFPWKDKKGKMRAGILTYIYVWPTIYALVSLELPNVTMISHKWLN